MKQTTFFPLLLCLSMTVTSLWNTGYSIVNNKTLGQETILSGRKTEEPTATEQTDTTEAEAMTFYQQEHPFTNEENLYYELPDTSKSNGFVEQRFDGSRKNKITIKNFDRLLYVDNEWVYYSKWPAIRHKLDKREAPYYPYAVAFCRMPVKRTAEGLQADPQEKERIYLEKDGYTNFRSYEEPPIFCDGHYLIYETASCFYRQYDIQNKKFIPLPEKLRQKYKNHKKSRKNYFVSLISLQNSTLIVTLHLKSLKKRHTYAIDLNTGEYTKINDEIIYRNNTAAANGSFYFTDVWSKDNNQVWHYQMDSHQKESIVTRKKLQQFLQDEQLWDSTLPKKKQSFYIHSLFATENKLYLQLALWQKKKTIVYENTVICSMTPDHTLQLEESLNACLVNPKKNRKKFVKTFEASSENAIYLTRGLCIYMTDTHAYLLLYNPEKKKIMLAFYHLTSGTFHYMTKKDREYYFPFAKEPFPFTPSGKGGYFFWNCRMPLNEGVYP